MKITKTELTVIFKAYDDYVRMLEGENNSLVPIAHVHGWRSSKVESGRSFRAKIKALKSKYLINTGVSNDQP